MGQPNAKDTRRPSAKRSVQGAAGPTARPGVRPSAFNDAVLQSPSVTGGNGGGGVVSPNATPSTRSSKHADPTRSTSASQRSSNSVSSAVNTAPASPTNTTKYPIVLRYVDKDTPALLERRKPMYVMVEALRWQPIAMSPSTDSFYTLLDLPPGNHNFRFLVDGCEVVDGTQPMAPSSTDAPIPVAAQVSSTPAAVAPLPKAQPPRDGKPANTIFLNDVLLTTCEDDDVMDEGGGWGQDPIMFEESRKYPPIVPLHLRYSPLNTPPTLVRCSKDGRMEVVEEGVDADLRIRPENMPLPLSVSINHVYFQRRDDHAVMGVTTRYCNKFTTVVYYTHMQNKPRDPLSG